MSDRICAGPIHGSPPIKEAVCISTRKVYDCCRYKDCQEDVRIYLTRSGQEMLERAVSVKPVDASLIWTYIDVESVSFNKGFYAVDIKFYYKLTIGVSFGVGRTVETEGLAIINKRLMMFGSEGKVKVFSSAYVPDERSVQMAEGSNMPIVVVDAVDPILLAVRLINQDCHCRLDTISEVPEEICKSFDDELIVCDCGKMLLATIGQFAIIRIERDIQLLIPAYDICMPAKECAAVESAQEACTLFSSFQFPVDQFFPPQMDCGCPK